MESPADIRLQAYAKINLTLDITGKRDDGYHYVDMIMQSVDLCDTITLNMCDKPGIFLEVISSDKSLELPANESNLAYRAAKAFLTYQELENVGIRILLDKKIPLCAGLAGGSADAAAVILGLDSLLDTRCSTAELADIGLSLGADVPFCLKGGTMNAEGIGEILTPLNNMPPCYILLCKPNVKIETPKAYAMFDSAVTTVTPDTEQVIGALAVGDLQAISEALCNVFEGVINLPQITSVKSFMIKYGALAASMSGSGPTVFGIFEKKSEAEKCASALRKQYSDVFVCTPVSQGVKIERNFH